MQHGIFVAPDGGVFLDECEHLLALELSRQQDLALQRAAQHDNAPLAVPAGQLKLAFQALPTRAGIGPGTAEETPLQVALDAFRQTQLEQIGLIPLFQLVHHRGVAKPAVAADQRGPLVGGQLIQHAQQAG